MLGKPHPEQDRVGGRPGHLGRVRVVRPFPRVGRSIPRVTGGPDEWLLPLLPERGNRIRLTDGESVVAANLFYFSANFSATYAAAGHRAEARVELSRVDVHSLTFFSHRMCLDSEWGAAVYAPAAVGLGGAWRLGSKFRWGIPPRRVGCFGGTSSTWWTTRGGWPSQPASGRRSRVSTRSALSSPSSDTAAGGAWTPIRSAPGVGSSAASCRRTG